ncbi:MFS transporter [Ottowia oryzae]|uniref:MFS transporter n=1 Tax=Ottowia oryzae TaxID=2109914 RepID=A0A2S0MEN3_9BURK|nr:MFS transporter [Ottowia oryzae]AVO34286.1 MFS transporter [Ottowia oryzae]
MNPAASTLAAAAVPITPTPLRQDARIIGLVGLAHASSHFAHLLLPPLFPVFAVQFGLSFSELGFLMTVFFFISGVGQAMSGFLVDKVGARPVLFAALGCFLAACLAGSVAQGWGGLLVVAVFAGLGNAPFHPVDFSILNQRVSGARLGYAFSAHGLSGNLGWALAPAFFALMVAFSNWRNAYLVAACMYVGVIVVMYLGRDKLRTEVVVHHRATQDVGGSAVGFLKLPVVWWCFSFFLLSTMTLAVVQNYASPILKALFQVSFETAAMTITAYMLCGALGMLIGGFVAARMPRRSDRVVALCMTAGAVLMAVCASGLMGASGTMVALAATGFAIGVGGPSRDMMIKRATPKGATGRVYGIVYSGLDTGFAVAPLVFGVMMDNGWYRAVLLGGAFTLLLAVGAALGVGLRTRAAEGAAGAAAA